MEDLKNDSEMAMKNLDFISANKSFRLSAWHSTFAVYKKRSMNRWRCWIAVRNENSANKSFRARLCRFELISINSFNQALRSTCRVDRFQSNFTIFTGKTFSSPRTLHRFRRPPHLFSVRVAERRERGAGGAVAWGAYRAEQIRLRLYIVNTISSRREI